MNKNKSILKIIVAMFIWGSVGIFVKNISLQSEEIAFFRATIGVVFIFLINMVFLKNSIGDIFINKNRKELYLLIFIGILLALNWIFLFQAYKYTTVGVATLTYYLAPAIVILLSPFITKEKLSLRSIASVILSISGLVCILINNNFKVSSSHNQMVGIIFGLMAAVAYAFIILLNKKIEKINPINRTLVQMFISALILLPGVVSRNAFKIQGTSTIISLIILGLVHTGIAYVIYFSSFEKVPTEKIATLSYLDPVSSVIFGMVFLRESVNINTIIGGILILGSSFIIKEPRRSDTIEETA